MNLAQRNTDVASSFLTPDSLREVTIPASKKPALSPPLFDLAEQEDCYLVAVDLPGFPNPKMELEARGGELQVLQPAPEGETHGQVLFRCRSLSNQVRAVYYRGALWLMLPKTSFRGRFESLSGLEEAAQLAQTSPMA